MLYMEGEAGKWLLREKRGSPPPPDQRPRTVEGQTGVLEDPRRHPVLAKNAKKQVVRADTRISETLGFVRRMHHHRPCPVRVGHLVEEGSACHCAGSQCMLQLVADSSCIQGNGAKHHLQFPTLVLSNTALSKKSMKSNDAEQDVLGVHGVVPQSSRFFAGDLEDPDDSAGEWQAS